MPESLPIFLQRNEDWSRSVFVTDDQGIAIDLTGMSVAMQVRDKLTQALVTNATCAILDATNGEILITLKGSVPPLSTYGATIQTVNLPYDIRVTDSDGFETILWCGLVVLSRGESM